MSAPAGPRPRPRLHVGLDNFGDPPGEGWRALLDVAAAADVAGIDAITVVDHVVLGEELGGYPYGAFPGGPRAPWLEPLTTLAAVAGRTSHVRLATGILIAPLRPPALLAKVAATLDVLSGGRLELGVGTGWLAKEYEAAGLDFAERGALLDDALAACEALWQGGATDFDSPRLRFSGAYCNPTPLQGGGVPFWIAGEPHSRNLARLARHGRGWIPSPTTRRDDIRAALPRLAEALRGVGRDPAELRVRVGLPIARDEERRPLLDASLARVPELLELGGTDVHVTLSMLSRDPAQAPALLAALADGFAANVA